MEVYMNLCIMHNFVFEMFNALCNVNFECFLQLIEHVEVKLKNCNAVFEFL